MLVCHLGKKFFIVCFVFSQTVTLCYGNSFFAESTFTLGLGAAIKTSEYRDTEHRILPMPIVQLDSGRFFWHGLSGGGYILQSASHNLALTFSYIDQEFDPQTSNNVAMQKLDARDPSFGVGSSYSFSSVVGKIKVAVTFDILDKSDGMFFDATYMFPVEFTRKPASSQSRSSLIFFRKATFTPYIGINWTNDKYNTYYYGVSSAEAERSGFNEYSADNEISHYAGVNLNVQLLDRWNIYFNSQCSWLGDELKNSPIVQEDMTFTFGGGVAYSF